MTRNFGFRLLMWTKNLLPHFLGLGKMAATQLVLA
jgi:hypothetical protein